MSHLIPGHSLMASDEPPFCAALRRAVDAIEAAGLDYLLMGGLGSSIYGRPRLTDDIDVFVRPEDAKRVLGALERAGFAVEETDPFWLFKAFWKGPSGRDVMLDVIFRSSGDIYLDDEMLSHAKSEPLRGGAARVMAPEDLLCVKAVTMGEAVPHHWFDALGLIAAHELDWEYLVGRATRVGLRRVLSLLVYAQSNDLGVPTWVIRDLCDRVLS